MAKNKLKNRTPLGLAVDKRLYEALNELQKETRIPKSRLLDEAIQLLLAKYGRQVPPLD